MADELQDLQLTGIGIAIGSGNVLADADDEARRRAAGQAAKVIDRRLGAAMLVELANATLDGVEDFAAVKTDRNPWRPMKSSSRPRSTGSIRPSARATRAAAVTTASSSSPLRSSRYAAMISAGVKRLRAFRFGMPTPL